MNYTLRKAEKKEITVAFNLLKSAAKTLSNKNIEQWWYWADPPIEKIKWVEDGFNKNEFFFIESLDSILLGMVRLSEEDLLYWGKLNDRSQYIHSLVILEAFSGKNIGSDVIKTIIKQAKENNFNFLRLDCDASNEKLCQYYLKQGFTQVGQKKLALGLYNLYQMNI